LTGAGVTTAAGRGVSAAFGAQAAKTVKAESTTANVTDMKLVLFMLFNPPINEIKQLLLRGYKILITFDYLLYLTRKPLCSLNYSFKGS
jgi:hypothetical protein